MTRHSAYILLLALFLLAACNEEKNDFMTPSSNIPVVNVNNEGYSVNGNVVGKTATDVSASEDLLIVPLESELKTIINANQEETLKKGQSFDWKANTAKLHVDDSLSFGDFFKISATMGFVGYPNIKYAIGTDFKDIYKLKLPTRSTNCFCPSYIRGLAFLRHKYMRHRQKFSVNEILALRNGSDYELECFENYNALDLLLSFYREDKEIVYVASLNEGALKGTPSFDGFTFYSFNKLADLWKFLGEICSRIEFQNEDKSVDCFTDLLGEHVTLVFEKDVLMKDIAPLIKGLKALGYDDRIKPMVVPE